MSGVPQDQCLPGKEAIQLARKGVRPSLPPYCPKEYRRVHGRVCVCVYVCVR